MAAERRFPVQHGQSRAAHRRLCGSDGAESSLMLDRAVDAVLRRIRLDRDHDVPYVAGYSQDGQTIYIDRHVPLTMRLESKDRPTDRYLILHEVVEKTLLDHLGLHYQHAHQIALRVEQAAVIADGISWPAYDQEMQRYILTIGAEELIRVPADLDLQPYRDEHDHVLLQRMAFARSVDTLPMDHPR